MNNCCWTCFIILGPALGSALYQAGGFLLPFLVVGSWCMLGAIGVLFVIPNVKMDDEKDAPVGKKLTLLDLAKVSETLTKYGNTLFSALFFVIFFFSRASSA